MSTLQRINDIEEEIARTQKNKATEYHIGRLKARLAQLRQELLVQTAKKQGGGIGGFDVCRRIRGLGSKMGIIMLTAMGQEADRVNGFMTGADDYVVKPFSVAELVARVDALYRRINGDSFQNTVESIKSGEFELNLRSRELYKNGRKIEITQVEFLIIRTFFKNVGKAMSREEITKMVWGENYQGDPKIVDVNMRRLRIKIEDDPAQPKHINTIWGFGYRWEA